VHQFHGDCIIMVIGLYCFNQAVSAASRFVFRLAFHEVD